MSVPEPAPPASSPSPAPAAPAPVRAPLSAPGRPLIDVGDGTLLAPPPRSPPAAVPPPQPPPAPAPPTVSAPAPRPIPQPGHALVDVGDGTLIEAPPATVTGTTDTGTPTPPGDVGDDAHDVGNDPEAGDEPTSDELAYWAAEADAVDSGGLLLDAVTHPAPGTAFGFPYQGTHGKAFNIAGGSDNWQSENAVDVWLYPGTHVLAVVAGVVSPPGWGFGNAHETGRFAGWRLHLVGDNGQVFYYTHMAGLNVLQGQRVEKGHYLGDSGVANGSPHLHFAARPPYDPRAFYKDAFTLKGRTSIGTSPSTGGPPAPEPNGDVVSAAWDELMSVFGRTLPAATEHVRDARRAAAKAVS